MTTLLAICDTHGTWDIDYDPPKCGCEYDLMVIGDQQELPYYEHLGASSE